MRTDYSHLNTVQLGSFGEAYSKMAFTLEGFEVYDSEYDDRGIDFVVRNANGVFFEVQVKTTGANANPFIIESKFSPADTFLFCAVRVVNDSLPKLYLARGSDWQLSKACLHHNPAGGDAGAYFEMRFAKKYESDLVELEFDRYVRMLASQE